MSGRASERGTSRARRRASAGGLALAVAVGAWAGLAWADEVPVTLQVQLLSKMSTYVANLPGGEGAVVKVLVVSPGAGDPSRGAQALVAALGQVGTFGSAKVEAKAVPLGDAKKLGGVLAAEKPQVLFLAPELDEKAAQSVVQAVGTSPVLTVTGTGDHVKLGVVLGFSLVEARPRVLLNLKQAGLQTLTFRAGLVSHSIVVDR